jgi:hypothetical protein
MSQEQKGKSGPRIHAQIAEIMAAVDAVGKERRNSGQGFQYRGIEDVMDALHPIFAEHKVYILSSVVDQKTEERTTAKGGNLIYRILTVDVSLVSGEDGSRETVRVVGEGMDSGDKAANKAMSTALKYALTQTLILPYGQADGDADSQPPSKPKGDAMPDPKLRSAYDGRTLKPGEEPEPPKEERPKPTTPAPTDQSAFNTRLYDAMALAGIGEEQLTAYLRKRGLITATQVIHNLSPKFVDAMMDGKDKATGKNNFALIADNIRAGKG